MGAAARRGEEPAHGCADGRRERGGDRGRGSARGTAAPMPQRHALARRLYPCVIVPASLRPGAGGAGSRARALAASAAHALPCFGALPARFGAPAPRRRCLSFKSMPERAAGARAARTVGSYANRSAAPILLSPSPSNLHAAGTVAVPAERLDAVRRPRCLPVPVREQEDGQAWLRAGLLEQVGAWALRPQGWREVQRLHEPGVHPCQRSGRHRPPPGSTRHGHLPAPRGRDVLVSRRRLRQSVVEGGRRSVRRDLPIARATRSRGCTPSPPWRPRERWTARRRNVPPARASAPQGERRHLRDDAAGAGRTVSR